MKYILSKIPEPEDVFKLDPEEYCYVVYMPIKVGRTHDIPDNLRWTLPLVDRVRDEDWRNFEYWYLTVKYMHVTGYGNRQGWHIDGYLTDDINYIWCDCAPTVFASQYFNLSEDHSKSLKEMEDQVCHHFYGQPNTLYRLDNTIVHRPSMINGTLLRAFIKVSCSNSIYNLEGNSRNPLISTDWEYKPRDYQRNHPVK